MKRIFSCALILAMLIGMMTVGISAAQPSDPPPGGAPMDDAATPDAPADPGVPDSEMPDDPGGEMPDDPGGMPGDMGGGPPGMGGTASSGVSTAEEFTDFASITHPEAVSLLVSLGVINGIEQEDGTYAFEPAKSINRESMAKMIALVVNLASGDEPDASGTARFSDVTGLWSENYVEFCGEKGIIDGMSDGVFSPKGTVTGYQTAKMLLAAMGVKNLTGDAWKDATQKAGGEIGLFEGVDADLDAEISRDDAAQLIYNALKLSDGSASVPTLIQFAAGANEFESLTVAGNCVLSGPAGTALTLTVDGVQKNLAAGTYEGKVVVTAAVPYVAGNMGSTYDYRTAVYVSGGIDETMSVSSAVISGEVTDEGAKDVVIDSQGDNFNGFIVSSGKYTIENAKINLNGHGGDDFAGYGAGIMTTGDADVIVDNADITTTGAIRSAIWAGGNSTLLVKNSKVVATDGKDMDFKVSMMKEVPWILGLSGNLRATNVLGAAKAIYLNSSVTAEKWGSLSTDSTQSGSSLTAINTDIIVSGESGYGSYADGSILNYYYGCRFNVPDQGLIVADGQCGATFGAATKENTGDLYDEITAEGKDAVTVINARIGVMWHKNKKGVITVKDGTVFNTSGTAFLIKSDVDNPAYPVLAVIESEINSESGVIYHLMESDDAGMNMSGGGPGSDTMWNSEYVVPEVVPVKDDNDVTAVGDTTPLATFTNVELEGNIYNSRWTAGQNISVTFSGSTIKGVISAGTQEHVNVKPGEKITKENYREISNVKVTPSEVVSNGVIVTLKDKSVWTVTETSYISSLTIEDGSSVVGKMTVDGAGAELKAGTYTGSIVITAE